MPSGGNEMSSARQNTGHTRLSFMSSQTSRPGPCVPTATVSPSHGHKGCSKVSQVSVLWKSQQYLHTPIHVPKWMAWPLIGHELLYLSRWVKTCRPINQCWSPLSILAEGYQRYQTDPHVQEPSFPPPHGTKMTRLSLFLYLI